jgi:hypothetical protein
MFGKDFAIQRVVRDDLSNWIGLAASLTTSERDRDNRHSADLGWAPNRLGHRRFMDMPLAHAIAPLGLMRVTVDTRRDASEQRGR